MKRVAPALLVLALFTCRGPAQPQPLYARGREAIQRGETQAAEQIAREGQVRFGAQPYWRELFAILEAESVVRADSACARRILQQTPATGAPLPAARRLIALAMTQKGKEADQTYLKADALAARAVPELRPEIAMRRAVPSGDSALAQQAISAAAAANQTWVLAAAYSILGRSESQKQQWPQAIEHYKLGVKYAQAAGSKRVEISSRVNLGWCYRELGDFDQALENLGPALSLAERESDDFHEHMALVLIAEIYVRRLELDRALAYANKALAVATTSKSTELGPKQLANSFHQLSHIEFELGHYEAAAMWNQKALEKRSNEPMGVLTDRVEEARILAATGNPARALEILESVLASCDPRDAPMHWRVQGIEADIYAKLSRLPDAEQRYEETLATGARARDRVKGSDSSLEFERNLLSFYDGYIDLMLRESRPADALRVAERSRARGLREAAEMPSAANVDPVALARTNNATILFYWLGARRSLLWTVTPGGIDVTMLPADDVIDHAADAYRNDLQSSRPSLATSTHGTDLYKMLIAPAKIAPSSRVIILPDSHLNALSFDALIVPGTPPHYWLEDVTVSYSPSLHQLESTPSWKAVRDPRVLVFGAVPAAGDDFPLLRQADAEIKNVTRHFGPARAVVFTGTAATPSSYKAAQPKEFPFIHFAAHATVNSGTPLDSSVILASDKSGFRLSGHQIVQVPLAAELVTVSSCNSAGRRSYAGEGLVGLAWAFLRAGAHRVVAAQSEVSDSAAPRLMDAMYGAMISNGMEPAEALRQAKLSLLRSDFKSPRYWAPFAVYGAM
jgi:CHAT domain-containing protein